MHNPVVSTYLKFTTSLRHATTMLEKFVRTALLLPKKPKKQPKQKIKTKKQPPSSLSHPGKALLQPKRSKEWKCKHILLPKLKKT